MENTFSRQKRPSFYTIGEWRDVLAKADQEGRKNCEEYPGTTYDAETLTWDFSGNAEAVQKFGAALPNYKMYLLEFSSSFGVIL